MAVSDFLQNITQTARGVSPILASEIEARRRRKLSIEELERRQRAETDKQRFQFILRNYEKFEPSQQRDLLKEFGIQPAAPGLQERIGTDISLSPEELSISREEEKAKRFREAFGALKAPGAGLIGKGGVSAGGREALGLGELVGQTPESRATVEFKEAQRLEKLEAKKATQRLGEEREERIKLIKSQILTDAEKRKGLTKDKKTTKDKTAKLSEHIKNLAAELKTLKVGDVVDPETGIKRDIVATGFEPREKRIREEIKATNKLIGILRGATKPQSLDEIKIWRRMGLIDAKFEKELKADLEGRVTTKAGKKFLELSKFPKIQARANIIRQSFKKGNVKKERAMRDFAQAVMIFMKQKGITQKQLETMVREFGITLE